MRLTAKITAVLLLGVLLLMVIAEFAMLRHENEEMTLDMRGDATQLSTTVSHIIEDLWELGGQQRALAALKEIDELRDTISVRIVYFDVERPNASAPLNASIDFTTLQLRHARSEYYRDSSGKEHLCTYARLAIDTRPAAIEIAEPIEHAARNSAYFALHAMILIGATAMLGAVMVIAIGGAWIGRPLRRLIEKTRRIGEGDLTGPLQLRRKDEFGELADALNSMCGQLQTAQQRIDVEAKARVAALDQLRHADRLRTVGRLAAGIAHELGTPLNVVSGRAALIASGRLNAEETRKSALTIKSEADRIATIIRQLLDFARRNTPQCKTVDLPNLTRQTIQLLAPIAEKRDCGIALVQTPDKLALNLDAGQIQQVLTNLIVNAVEAMPNGGQVELTIEQVTAKPPEDANGPERVYARLAVCDRGDGISPEIKEQIFEPFFTTKDVGDGTGLGLSIAYGMVREHGGWIAVESESGQGSCFSVFLPMEAAPCKDES